MPLDLADRPMGQISGGQRQKVYLAMGAWPQDTQTIFMDEPTAYLDIRHRLEVMALARRLADMGRAVVLVLHDLDLALKGADRVAVLADGTLRQTGSPEEIFSAGILDEVVRRVCAPGADRGRLAVLLRPVDEEVSMAYFPFFVELAGAVRPGGRRGKGGPCARWKNCSLTGPRLTVIAPRIDEKNSCHARGGLPSAGF